MKNLFNCNTVQSFSEPTIFPEGHLIKLSIEDFYDEDGKPIEIFKPDYVPHDTKCNLLIIEVYHHSIFSREYGAGKTLNTFTLLPGEETTICISSTSTSTTDTSSILDSFNSTSEADYKSTVEENETDQQTNEELTQVSGSAKGRSNWGLNTAKASGSFNGSMQSARESYANKMTNALASHASSQSAKRTVEVQTLSMEASKSDTENVQRTIKNPNKNRTLNFVFRQLNQRFVCIRHLVDVKIGVEWEWNDSSGHNYEMLGEYPLTQLEEVLKKYIKDAPFLDFNKYRRVVKKNILAQLDFFDYNDDLYQLYEEVAIKPKESREPREPKVKYLRFKRCVSTYDDTDLCKCVPINRDKEIYKISNDECIEPITVPGYILNVHSHIMKTHGVIVDSLLGSNDAYEDCLLAFRNQAYKGKELDNCMKQLLIDRERLAQEIVKNSKNDDSYCDQATTRYKKIFCCDSSVHDCNDDEHGINDK
ncbi:hypothetical protein COF67_22250 [Bacillus toyonensis]|uniref:hypothetical protein n=1 Tax=Bacillus toyonensis TaxID=155322 RepID=UPI000BFD58D5|nr:hypothetical protein [Bacillus toyonensis]PHD46571.1 hypothetical protein COF67_22250 [Bacillus toyonensis]